jgi:hypothetical protein
MINTTSLQANPTLSTGGEKTSPFSSDIRFDDEHCSPEDLQLEATKQIIWEKLRVRLRQRKPAFWS